MNSETRVSDAPIWSGEERLEALVEACRHLEGLGTVDEVRASLVVLAQRLLSGEGAFFALSAAGMFTCLDGTGSMSSTTGGAWGLEERPWRDSESPQLLTLRSAPREQGSFRQQLAGADGCSLAVVPVHLEGTAAAVLVVVGRRGQLVERDATTLTILAAFGGAELRRRRERVLQDQQRSTQARLVLELARLPEGGSNLSDLRQRIVRLACELTRADSAELEPLDLGASTMRFPMEQVVPAGHRNDDRTAHVLGASIHAGGAVDSLLRVWTGAKEAFSAYDELVLRLLAQSASHVLDRYTTTDLGSRTEHLYRMLFDHNPHPMWVFDVETLRFLAVNLAAVEQYGYSQEEFLGMTLRDIRPPSEIQAMELAVRQLKDDKSIRGLRRHLRRGGEVIDVEITSDPIVFGGRRARLVLAHDVTARLRAEAGQASAARALRILSACNAAMVRIHDEPRLLEEVCRIVVHSGGYKLARVGFMQNDPETSVKIVASVGVDVEGMDDTRLSWDEGLLSHQDPAVQTVRTGQVVIVSDLAGATNFFPWRDAALKLGLRSAITLPLKCDGDCFGFIGLYSDEAQDSGGPEIALLREFAESVSFGVGALRAERERIAVERKLADQAIHDMTTGLLRYSVQEPEIAALLANPNGKVAVLILNIDRFKAVNESLGYLVADHVLRCIAERISERAGEHVVVAHVAADEFLVAFNAADEQAAHDLAAGLRAAVAEPIEADGYRLVLSATVGLSSAPEHGVTPAELTRAARAAVERGKQMGRDQTAVFGLEQQREIEDRVTLGVRLRSAASRGELCLHFQPQFSANARRLTGFEALLRWDSPEIGSVSPGRFIPLAEALGLMPEIGAWVIREACRHAKRWLDLGYREFVLAINVSAQQLQRPGLLATVVAALAESGVPPTMLDIEITESSLMENVGRAKEALADLKRLGVKLSLDDFGTGYSSLAYLKTFALDKVKIDQSFVRGLPENQHDAAIARMIVSIGHELGLQVAAEGVETEAQASFLNAIGCDELQGYLLGRPVPADQAVAFFGEGDAR